MTGKKYTAALIGCGRIGFSLGLDKKREQPASHTMALLDNSSVSIIAGCDSDPERRKDWSDWMRKVPVFSDSSSLYARHKPDIITVAVNECDHKKEALAAIRAKPRLLILEKPVALNIAEAEDIRAAAEEYNVPVLINHERRFAEDFIAAKNYIPEIGSIQSIKAELCSSMCVYNPAEEGTGAYSLIHDGTHLVDAVLYFLEEEKEKSGLIEVPVKNTVKGLGLLNSILRQDETKTRKVSAILNSPVMTGIYRDENGRVRQMSAHYSTERCPDVTVTISGRSMFFGFEITVTGTEGRICIGNGYLKLYRREKSSLYTGFYSLASDRSRVVPRKTLYFANMIKNAVAFLDGKEELRSDLDTGINALAMLEEIKAGLTGSD